jgi:hypothetical protein
MPNRKSWNCKNLFQHTVAHARVLLPAGSVSRAGFPMFLPIVKMILPSAARMLQSAAIILPTSSMLLPTAAGRAATAETIGATIRRYVTAVPMPGATVRMNLPIGKIIPAGARSFQTLHPSFRHMEPSFRHLVKSFGQPLNRSG